MCYGNEKRTATEGQMCYGEVATKKQQRRRPVAMNGTTQDIRFRPSRLKYAQKPGGTRAAIRYKNRQHVCRTASMVMLPARGRGRARIY